MLLEVFIENFILIEKESISFSDGLNIITGETGSGKSIILSAIKTLLGQNTSKDIIMTGKESALIEGVFSLESPETIDFINSNGFSAEENEIIISREINRKRSSVKINGRPCLNGFIKELGDMLLDFHGQSDSLTLLNASKQLEIVDDFSGEKVAEKKSEVSAKYSEIKKIEEKISEIEEITKLDPREIDFLKYQIDEIEKAYLILGEDEELEGKLDLLKNSEQVRENLRKASDIINENAGIRDSLYSVSKLLSEIGRYDGSLRNFSETIEEIIINTEDLHRELRSYMENCDVDDEEIYNVESRLNIINEFKRKYGRTIEDILLYLEKSKKTYDDAMDSQNALEKLNKTLALLRKEYMLLAKELSTLRKKAALEFEEKILAEFKDLNMSNARLKVEFKENSSIARDGIDDVVFTISTNLGEPYKAISKIASGGEISRIMLGIKTVLKDSAGDRAIVYDEIDSGISGKTAEIIGVKMHNVSKKNQIISVTHLPQIAVMAENHIVVEKVTENGRTYSRITNANSDIRKSEIARLISGRNISDITISNVEEMIKYSETLKL